MAEQYPMAGIVDDSFIQQDEILVKAPPPRTKKLPLPSPAVVTPGKNDNDRSTSTSPKKAGSFLSCWTSMRF